MQYSQGRGDAIALHANWPVHKAQTGPTACTAGQWATTPKPRPLYQVLLLQLHDLALKPISTLLVLQVLDQALLLPGEPLQRADVLVEAFPFLLVLLLLLLQLLLQQSVEEDSIKGGTGASYQEVQISSSRLSRGS